MKPLTHQVAFGLTIALVVVSTWFVWHFWSRAMLAAVAIAAIPPSLALFGRPNWGLAAIAFSITSYLNAFLPYATLVALVMTLAVVSLQKLYRNDAKWRITPFVGWSLLLFVWAGFSLIWTARLDFVWFTPFVYCIILMLLVSELVRTPLQLRNLLIALGIGTIFTAVSTLYGVYELFSTGLAAEIASGSIETLTSARYKGHWAGANQLAHTIMPFVALYVPFISYPQSLPIRILFALSVFSGTIAVAISLSRAALLSMVLALTAVILTYRRRWLIVSTVIVAVLLIVLVLPVDLIGRIESFTKGRGDASIDQRAQLLETGWEMAVDAFPLGFGMGSFYDLIQDYLPNTWVAFHSHNTYIQILIEYGVVGAALFSLMILSLVFALRREGNKSDRHSLSQQCRIAFVATFFGLLISMLFESMVGWNSYWLMFTLISIYPSVFGQHGPPLVTR